MHLSLRLLLVHLCINYRIDIANCANQKSFSIIQPSVSLNLPDAHNICIQHQEEIALINNDQEWDDASNICINNYKCWIKFRYKNIASIPNNVYEQHLLTVFTSTTIPEEWCGILNNNQLIIPYDCSIIIPSIHVQIPSILCQSITQITTIGIPTNAPSLPPTRAPLNIQPPTLPPTFPLPNTSPMSSPNNGSKNSEDQDVPLPGIIVIIVIAILLLVLMGALIIWNKNNEDDEESINSGYSGSKQMTKRDRDNKVTLVPDNDAKIENRKSNLKKYNGFSDDDFYHDIDDSTYDYESSTF